MESKFLDKIAIRVVIPLILLAMCYTIYTEMDVSNNKQSTTGTILAFKYINTTRYKIEYEYQVKNETYVGITGVEYFKCDNGKDGCVGSRFDVYYSSENPEYSRIHLGKYNEHQTTVQFFE